MITCRFRVLPWIGVLCGLLTGQRAGAVMYNRDTGSSQSINLANLPPFASRANIGGCTAVLIAPNVLLSAAHCVNYAGSGTVTASWNGQTRSGAAFTNIGADHLLIVTATPFTGTLGKMTAPYSGSAESGKLAWKVGSGGSGVLGPGSTGPFYDGVFRAMTTRLEVNNVASPPSPVTTDFLYYDFDGPPSRLNNSTRPTTYHEGGTAPGDSGGPLYMFENGRWHVIGVTSGPDAGYYRDGRVRTDMAQIESATGYSWARPTTPALEMRWVAQDLVATLADGSAVTSWPRQGGTDAWSNATANGAVGSASLVHNATPTGRAAIDFPGTARLALPAASNPVGGETAFSVAMVVQVDGSSADKLVVTGALNITNLSLDITTPGSGATLPAYVLASYESLTGSAFTSVTGIPSGYSLVYNYNDGVSTNNIALVTATSSPYSTWADTTYGLTGDDALAGSDPDGDGVKNIVEFALNGNPTSGSNNGLTSTLIQDASSPAGDELTYTLAVRDGATFSSGAGGSQTATVDGVIYTVQGSVDLSAFTSAVSVIGSASDTAAGLPSLAGTSWEYRTFKLDASEGLGGKGFLRVKIETAP